MVFVLRSVDRKINNMDILAKRHANNGLDNVHYWQKISTACYVKEITKFLSS